MRLCLSDKVRSERRREVKPGGKRKGDQERIKKFLESPGLCVDMEHDLRYGCGIKEMPPANSSSRPQDGPEDALGLPTNRKRETSCTSQFSFVVEDGLSRRSYRTQDSTRGKMCPSARN